VDAVPLLQQWLQLVPGLVDLCFDVAGRPRRGWGGGCGTGASNDEGEGTYDECEPAHDGGTRMGVCGRACHGGVTLSSL